MKKLLSLILVVAMVMSFAITVSAADPVTYNFDPTTDVTAGVDKDVIPAGTVYDDYFTVSGTVTQRVNSEGVYCVEIAKNETGSLDFTVTNPATVEMQVSSTGTTNTSTFAIYDADGNAVANNEGLTEVTGSSSAKIVVTYTLEPGNYKVVSPTHATYKRGFRLFYLTVVETPVDTEPLPGETPENPLTLSYPGKPVDTEAIPAGGSLYYNFYNIAGYPASFTGNIDVVYNGETYTPVGGVTTVDVPAGDRRQPVAMQLVNKGDTDVVSTLDLVFPLGSEQRPANLVIGTNSGTPVLNNWDEGTYLYNEFVVDTAGTMTIALTSESADYTLNVGHGYSYLDNSQFENGVITFEVEAGDSIYVDLTLFDAASANADFTIQVTLEPNIDTSLNGLVKAEDGTYNYYVNGIIDTEFVGLVDNAFGSWYVSEGKIQFGYNGLITFEGKTYDIHGGQVNVDKTGLIKRDGAWYYVAEGVVDAAYTGFAKSGAFTYYVENGELNFKLTDVIEVEGVKYFVKYGNVATGYTGLVKGSDGVWRYVAEGVFDATYTGTAKGNDGVTFYYVQNGLIDFKFSGTIVENGTEFTVKNGVVIAE